MAPPSVSLLGGLRASRAVRPLRLRLRLRRLVIGRLSARRGDVPARQRRPAGASRGGCLGGGRMSKAHPPELKKFMDKKLSLKLNGGRHVQGILRGFDPFMNLVIDECVEMAPGGQQNNIGMVVIRGNSIIMLEALERV